MATGDGFDQGRGEFGNEKDEQSRHGHGHGQKNRAPKPVRQRPANRVTQRQRDQNHANLADPDIERIAKILGQIARADDLQHHDGEASQKNDQRGRDFQHGELWQDGGLVNSLLSGRHCGREHLTLVEASSWLSLVGEKNSKSSLEEGGGGREILTEKLFERERRSTKWPGKQAVWINQLIPTSKNGDVGMSILAALA